MMLKAICVLVFAGLALAVDQTGYLGCFEYDRNDFGNSISMSNSPAACVNYCKTLSGQYFALVHLNVCACASVFPGATLYAYTGSAQGDGCSTPCSGDPLQYCGSTISAQIYQLTTAIPQNQWAFQIQNYSTRYSSSYDATLILGAPVVNYTDSSQGWNPSTINGTEFLEFSTLYSTKVVGFQVYENFRPQTLYKISVKASLTDSWSVIWTGVPTPNIMSWIIFNVNTSSGLTPVSFPTKYVRFDFNNSLSTDFIAIDAVYILGETTTSPIPPNIAPSALKRTNAAGYIGCFVNLVSGDIQEYNITMNSTTMMTPQTCVTYCNGQGYPIAALQQGSVCACGETFGTKYLANTKGEYTCFETCSGNVTLFCGGIGASDVYQASSTPPKKQYVMAVQKFSSTYYSGNDLSDSFDYGYNSILGAPDVSDYSDDINSWSPEFEVYNAEYLEFSIGIPVLVTKVHVIVSHAPQTVTKISTKANLGDSWSVLYSGAPSPNNATVIVDFAPTITQVSFATAYFRVDMDNSGNENGYPEIDAVIIEADTSFKITPTYNTVQPTSIAIRANITYPVTTGVDTTGEPDFTTGQMVTTGEMTTGEMTTSKMTTSRIIYYTTGLPRNISDHTGYLGCFRIDEREFALSKEIANITPSACISACQAANYPIAAVTPTVCNCGNTFASIASLNYTIGLECQTACPGDKTLTCGGSKYAKIYRSSAAPPPQQWAMAVQNYSSAHGLGSSSWSAFNMLGAPNVFPAYGDSPMAWSPKTKNGTEYLEFSIGIPAKITKVLIYETYCPQTVVKISTRAALTDSWTVMWAGKSNISTEEIANIFSPTLTKTLDVETQYIRLDFDNSGSLHWPEIDAVMIEANTTGYVNPTGSTSQITSGPSNVSGNDSAKSGLSGGAKAAIAILVIVVVAVAIAIGVTIFLVLRKRKQDSHQHTELNDSNYQAMRQ